jgi:hypothetical protein
MNIENTAVWYDLSVTMWEVGEAGLLALAAYDSRLFEAETIRTLLKHFHHLIHEIVAAPETRLKDLSLAPEYEQSGVVDVS